MGADVVEHGSEVLGWTVRKFEVFFRFARSGKEATQFDGVVWNGFAFPNVAAFVAILDVFERAPGAQLGQRRKATADREKSLDRAARAEKKFKPLGLILFGTIFGRKNGLSRFQRPPLDQVD